MSQPSLVPAKQALKISPYIFDQGWSLLVDYSELKADLARKGRRQRPGVMPLSSRSAPERRDPWQRIVNRDDILFALESTPDNPVTKKSLRLRRLIVTTDSGMGKSSAMEWLEYRLNCPDAGTLAFRIDAADLEGGLEEFKVAQRDVTTRLVDWMAGKIVEATSKKSTLQQAREIVERHRRMGTLVLLVDGLDHVSRGISNLLHILRTPYWTSCRFVVAGRPYSLRTRFSELKLDQGWEFLWLEEFTPEQQTEYLGSSRRIPPRASAALSNVLTVPRMLYYMRHHVSERDFQRIRTGSDVYWLAVQQMILEAMKGSEEARKLGLKNPDFIPAVVSEDQLRACLNLLAAIAYVMTLGIAENLKCKPVDSYRPPNFDRLPRGQRDTFDTKVRMRYSTTAANDLTQDLTALAAMNDFLRQGVFDADVSGLKEIEFRNRSLQEWLTAYYLATRATEDDSNFWFDRLYLPHEPRSEEFYAVWEFLVEMPGTRPPGITTESTNALEPALLSGPWLHAIEPLYRRTFEVTEKQADGTLLTTRDARRSCEMIFRSWPTLQHSCAEGYEHAEVIQERWWGEFESILADSQGSERQIAALEFQDDLLLIPAGEFQMGSPPAKAACMPDTERGFWIGWYSRVHKSRSNWAGHLEEALSQFWFGRSRAELASKESLTQLLTQAAEACNTSEFLRQITTWRCPSDETPLTRAQTVQSFFLSRRPLINKWWRLFAPQHGLRTNYPDYSRISPTPEHPAIYIDWFSAWCLCQWAKWNKLSCQLPWENQWEYAAKFGTSWDWRYWWGDDSDKLGEKITADGNWKTGSTTMPIPAHANPHTRGLDHEKKLGLMDMLGNVQEWCQDQYREVYERHGGDEPGDASSSRCVRGGSFVSDPERCRSARRRDADPSNSRDRIGVRVSRAASD